MPPDLSANNPVYIPLTEEQVRQKKTRSRRNIIYIFCALAVLTVLEVYFLKQQTTTIADNISVLLLFNVIIILLFLLITLIIRNLVKLYNERKSKKIGSKFQTKLIIAFLILALVPSILLFSIANKLFSYSIGNWFSLQVERSLQQSMEVAREYYAHMESKSQYLHEMGSIYEKYLDDQGSAIDFYEQAMDMHPQNVESAEPLVGVYLKDERWERAEPLLDLLVANKVGGDLRELQKLHYNCGRVAQALRKDDKALIPPRLVEAEVYDAEVRPRLNACLETVPTQQRLAFLLREVEGFTTQEICKILQVSRTNLGVLLYRARNRLRECLETQGVKGES